MSFASAHAAVLYQEVAKSRRLWTVRDEGGFPAPLNGEGKRAQPFWSSKSRVEKVIAAIPAYAGFEPFVLELDTFIEQWVPGLTKDDILVGVNWTGSSATGFDVAPAQVVENILAQSNS